MDARLHNATTRRPLPSSSLSWLYFGQFFLLNLFVATVVNNFMRIKRNAETDAEEQRPLFLPPSRGNARDDRSAYQAAKGIPPPKASSQSVSMSSSPHVSLTYSCLASSARIYS